VSSYDWDVNLRERKKQATRTAIADTALGLFVERGFDRVTVAEVAQAADVSVNTVFNYFPTKEDLFFDRQADVVLRLAHAVDARRPGESAVAAVRRAFVEAVARDDPTVGLSPQVAQFWRVVEASPALQARLRWIGEQAEAALAARLAALGPPGRVPARVAAALIVAVDRVLYADIRRRMLAGDDPATVRAEVTALAGSSYALLEPVLAA
jgi:AcrR family transcriptional regulator